MQLSNETRNAPANAIDSTGNHLFWSRTPEESLIKSISDFGQVAPILVRDTEHGLELIAGHGRLAALHQQGSLVLMRMVNADTDIEKGLLYMTDNSQRPLDDGMRLAALRYFHPLMDTKGLQSDIMPRLGVKPKSKDAKLFLAWLELPSIWQANLVAGRVPLAAAAPLARMDNADRSAVEPLFTSFSWSRSNAVNILNWLFESSKMTDSPVADVMDKAGMNDIMRQGLSPKDTIARLTASANEARYPELSKLQNHFATTARELSAGTKWRIIQPNNFETNGAEITIQIKDAEQLLQAVTDLEAMAQLSPWQEIWKLGGKND